jgi:hypothetical protein
MSTFDLPLAMVFAQPFPAMFYALNWRVVCVGAEVVRGVATVSRLAATVASRGSKADRCWKPFILVQWFEAIACARANGTWTKTMIDDAACCTVVRVKGEQGKRVSLE